jgi:hypothetical protein
VLLLTLAAVAPSTVAAADFPAKDSRYHSYAEMVQVLQDLEDDYPAIVDVFSIGQSYQGRELWAVKISDNVATDEPEPEVLFDSLHHAREHLGLEQSLALLRWLTTGYGTDARVTSIVNSREIWVIPSVNPDGAEFDLTGDPYREWRKNRQPNAGSSHRGTDLNRNYGYHWGCCGGSSGSTAAITYRGSSSFSAPETQAMRDFMLSRRIDGQQQIQVAITFHTAGQEVLWPYGYTYKNVPYDMTDADQAALEKMGRKMASLNGYTPKQSSGLYITDGDEIDWAYGTQRIWMYTFELYPSAARDSTIGRHYPPDELIGREVARNKEAIFYLIEHASCRYSVLGTALANANCGPFFDDFETSRGWEVDPLDTDTATGGAWARANPSATTWQSTNVPSGSRALVTGWQAGASTGANDVDGGTTTIRSISVGLFDDPVKLTFRYAFGYASNATVDDHFRAYVEESDGDRTLVWEEFAPPGGHSKTPRWTYVSVSLAPWDLQDIRIVFEAADGGSPSTVEAAVDDVRIRFP